MSARLAMRATYHAIDSGSDHVWPELTRIWRNSLPADTRAKLALAAMYACDGRHAEAIAEHVIDQDANLHLDSHAPVAPLYSYMDEAAFWADMAIMAELKAYLVAIFSRLPAHERAAFLNWADRRRAAA